MLALLIHDPIADAERVAILKKNRRGAGPRRRHRPEDLPAHVARGLAIEVGVRPLVAYATAAGLEANR